MKTVIQMFMVWLLMAIFSWSFVAQKLNRHNQNVTGKIANGTLNYYWDLDKQDDIVSSFQQDWQMVADGVLSQNNKAEISLHMNGRLIDTALHSQLLIRAETESVDQAIFKLEMSDQRSQLFYDSPELAGSLLNQAIDLSRIQWQVNSPNQPDINGQLRSWSSLPTLDAVVLRFYLLPGSTLTLQDIAIKQNADSSVLTVKNTACVDVSDQQDIGCWVTNQMQFQHQQQQQLSLLNQLNFPPPLVPPVIYLLLSAALVIWTTRGILPAKLSTNEALWITAFLAVVPLVVWALHQTWMTSLATYFKWLLMVCSLLLVWHFRSCLRWPEKAAYPLLLITLAVVLVVLALNGFEFKFLKGLPFYFIWAWIQQLMIGPMVSAWLQRKCQVSDFKVAFMVGVLFSVIHAPNHMLMLATLVAGVVWSYSWLRYQNMYINSISHAFLALVFYQVMPEAWLGTARIGVFF